MQYNQRGRQEYTYNRNTYSNSNIKPNQNSNIKYDSFLNYNIQNRSQYPKNSTNNFQDNGSSLTNRNHTDGAQMDYYQNVQQPQKQVKTVNNYTENASIYDRFMTYNSDSTPISQQEIDNQKQNLYFSHQKQKSQQSYFNDYKNVNYENLNSIYSRGSDFNRQKYFSQTFNNQNSNNYYQSTPLSITNKDIEGSSVQQRVLTNSVNDQSQKKSQIDQQLKQIQLDLMEQSLQDQFKKYKQAQSQQQKVSSQNCARWTNIFQKNSNTMSSQTDQKQSPVQQLLSVISNQKKQDSNNFVNQIQSNALSTSDSLPQNNQDCLIQRSDENESTIMVIEQEDQKPIQNEQNPVVYRVEPQSVRISIENINLAQLSPYVNQNVGGLICQYCNNILQNPVQLACKHAVCKECVNDGSEIKCHSCNTNTQIVKDMEYRKIGIGFLPVFCIWKPSGCGWNGQSKHLQNHLQMCEYNQPRETRQQQIQPSFCINRHLGCQYYGSEYMGIHLLQCDYEVNICRKCDRLYHKVNEKQHYREHDYYTNEEKNFKYIMVRISQDDKTQKQRITDFLQKIQEDIAIVEIQDDRYTILQIELNDHFILIDCFRNLKNQMFDACIKKYFSLKQQRLVKFEYKSRKQDNWNPDYIKKLIYDDLNYQCFTQIGEVEQICINNIDDKMRIIRGEIEFMVNTKNLKQKLLCNKIPCVTFKEV